MSHTNKTMEEVVCQMKYEMKEHRSSFDTGFYFSPVTLSFQQPEDRAHTAWLPQAAGEAFPKAKGFAVTM